MTSAAILVVLAIGIALNLGLRYTAQLLKLGLR